MIELAKQLGQLAGEGLATLLILIIVGSYFDVWVWGRQLKKTEADADERLQWVEAERAVQLKKSEDNCCEWKAVAKQVTGMAEALGKLADRRVKR